MCSTPKSHVTSEQVRLAAIRFGRSPEVVRSFFTDIGIEVETATDRERATERAVHLINVGQSDVVRGALMACGVRRVRELDPVGVLRFLAITDVLL